MPIDPSTRSFILLATALCVAAVVLIWSIGLRKRLVSRGGLVAALAILVVAGLIIVLPMLLVTHFLGSTGRIVFNGLSGAVLLWMVREAVKRDPSRTHAIDVGLQLGAITTLASAFACFHELRDLERLPELQRRLATAIASGKRHEALQRAVDNMLRRSHEPAWTHLLLAVSACAGIALLLALVLAVHARIGRSLLPVLLVVIGVGLVRRAVLHHPIPMLLVEVVLAALAVAYVRHELRQPPPAPRVEALSQEAA